MHDVYVAIRILRRDLLHVLLENFVTKRSNQIVQLLLEHKGIFSFLRVWNKKKWILFPNCVCLTILSAVVRANNYFPQLTTHCAGY